MIDQNIRSEKSARAGQGLQSPMPLCIWVGRESGQSSQHFCHSFGIQVTGVSMQIRKCNDMNIIITVSTWRVLGRVIPKCSVAVVLWTYQYH